MYPVNIYTTTNLLKAGLEAIGYQHETLVLDGRYFSRYTSPRGCKWVTSNARITYPFIGSTAKEVSKDKRTAYALAETVGITIPFTRTVQAVEDAAATWQEVAAHKPLIVKPSNATLSRGLTMNVTDEVSLVEAITLARQHSDTVLIQKQVQGQEVRMAVLDGTCVAVINRRNAQLAGDGRLPVRQLLEQENQQRADLKLPYIVYPKLEAPTVDLTGLDMSKVLADGEILELGRSAMVRRGASAYNVTGAVHESYKRVAEKLAVEFGPGFVAVDLLIEDFTKPLTTNNYAFLEFNMSPNLGVFYCCRDGNQFDIVEHLVPMIDKALHGGEPA